MGGHRALQFIEEFRVDGIHGINQRRDRRMRRGTQEPPDGVLGPGAFHLFPGNPGPIDERLAAAFALDEPLAAQSIDDLGNGRVDEPLGFADMAVHVAHRRRVEFPELLQHGVFQFVGGQSIGLHVVILSHFCYTLLKSSRAAPRRCESKRKCHPGAARRVDQRRHAPDDGRRQSGLTAETRCYSECSKRTVRPRLPSSRSDASWAFC